MEDTRTTDSASDEKQEHRSTEVASPAAQRDNAETNQGIDVESAPKAPPALPFNPADFPDGGLTAWLVVAGSWFCLFCSFGWVNCIGVFQDYYEKNQLRDYPSSTIAWIPSTETFMMFGGGPIFGKVFDSYGSRYMLLGGTVLHVFGLMMTSLSSQYYQIFLAQSVASGIGTSAIFYSGVSCVPTWFFKKRATALGIVASGASLGGVIFPIMVTKLIPQIGFAWTIRSVAFVILGVLVFANLTVKSRLQHKPSRVNVVDFFRPLGEPAFALTVSGAFMFFFGTFLPFNFIILQAESVGMSSYLASFLIPMLNAAR
jgi:MFS family permease